MKIGEWDNLGRARGLVQRQIGELGATEYAAHVTVNAENGRLRRHGDGAVRVIRDIDAGRLAPVYATAFATRG